MKTSKNRPSSGLKIIEYQLSTTPFKPKTMRLQIFNLQKVEITFAKWSFIVQEYIFSGHNS